MLKTAYTTNQLNLTQKEEQKLWPVYNSYFAEIKQSRLSNLNDEVAYEEKVVEIRKKYKGDFKRILFGDDRVNRLFIAEKNFHDLLSREQQRRNGKRQGGP